MKIIILSTDQKIFDSSSEVYRRMISYGSLFEETHIIVHTNSELGLENKFTLDKNTFAYPTNSAFKIFYVFNVFFIARKILKESARKHKWVITSQDPFETGLAGYLLKCVYRLPLQIQVHTDFLSLYFAKESTKNKFRALVGKWLIKRADGIRVVSGRIKKSIITYHSSLSSKIIVLPVFVNIEQIRIHTIKTDLHKKYPQFNFIILIASRLTREKNIGMAIEAMQKIVSKYPKIGLVIVGSGPEKNTIQNMITIHNLKNNVILELWTDDLVSYYKTADCYVLTSNYEGYGRTVIEAMASGCPVIMTDVGVAGDVVQDTINGRIIQTNHSKELSDIIMSLHVDTILRKKYTIAGYESIALLQSKQSKNRFFELWEKALGEAFVYYNRKKLCYVLPKYIEKDSTHFAHIHGFLKEIAKSIDLYLIVERGILPSDNLGATNGCVTQPRITGLVWHIARARISGYRHFYIHYSFVAALVASLLVRWNGGIVFYWNCGEPWKFKRSFLREQLERMVYKMISFLVTGTPRMKEAYGCEYNIPLTKIKILSNWIDIKRFITTFDESRLLRSKLGINIGTKVILFAHHLSKRKGADLIIPVFQALKQKHDNVVILVIGSGPEEGALLELISRFNLKGQVFLLGSVPNTVIQNYFGISDVFFMPSREEGFPHVLLEAMAVGVPFVACNVGGVRDIIPTEMQSYVVDTQDPNVLASYIQKVLNLAQDERTTLSLVLKKWVLQYNLKEVTNRFFEVIYE